MAENTMVKEQLTEEMVEAGAQLTQKLLDMGVPIDLAMWFFKADTNDWRLLYASPLVATEGSRVVYEKILQARKAIGPAAERLAFSSIGLKQTNDRLVQLLQKSVSTGPEVARVRLSRNAIEGQYIDDVLIYRSAA
jgi:hypothetical protein